MRPIFDLLNWLFKHIGNFGVAIICLTLIVRGLMFPIAQKQFQSMAAMRKLQPKMKAIQERYKDDKPRLRWMLKLYQEDQPGGCAFDLFRSVFTRSQVLFGARSNDAVNLFGLLPFHPPGFLAIGVLPILLASPCGSVRQPQQMDCPTADYNFMPWI
jgi:YidC/Oxa1 family membrane protein insertase